MIQNIYYDPKNTRHMATCKCDCGNTKDIVLNLILYGHTKACGCQLAENGKKVLDKYVNDGTRVTNYKYKARNDTGVKGVEKTPANRYRARIWYKGKAISLGTYDTLEEAKNARLTAEEKYFKPEIEKFNKKMEDENTEQFKIKFD